MGNPLGNTNGPRSEMGRDVQVSEHEIPVTIGFFSILFEIFVWAIGFVVAGIITHDFGDQIHKSILVLIWLAAFLPGVFYTIAKVKAKNYFLKLSQVLQARASDIENLHEQRYIVLKNLSDLLSKSITLDKDVMTAVAAYRGGANPGDLNQNAEVLNRGFASLVPHLEAYPELKAQFQIAEAMRQNDQLQREITAARNLYNQKVQLWNTEIFSWPVKQIVAARNHYTTMIPYIASASTVEGSRGNFFA